MTRTPGAVYWTATARYYDNRDDARADRHAQARALAQVLHADAGAEERPHRLSRGAVHRHAQPRRPAARAAHRRRVEGLALSDARRPAPRRHGSRAGHRRLRARTTAGLVVRQQTRVSRQPRRSVPVGFLGRTLRIHLHAEGRDSRTLSRDAGAAVADVRAGRGGNDGAAAGRDSVGRRHDGAREAADDRAAREGRALAARRTRDPRRCLLGPAERAGVERRDARDLGVPLAPAPRRRRRCPDDGGTASSRQR